jgi:predicted O-methyltransferase YrrM
MKRTLKRAARTLSVRELYRRVGAKLLRSRPQTLMRFTQVSVFSATQKEGEFLGLLALLREDPPRRVLEIGTARGGTFFMFCQVADPAARLVTIDLKLPPFVSTFGRKGQEICAIEADSHAAVTEMQVVDFLGEPIDFLFIDGDHSYAGVVADFERYSPHLRDGGTVAFHDIVPDKGGDAWAGDVPTFWQELKERDGWRCTEYVNSWDQDGFGIGVAQRAHGRNQ